MEHPVSPARRDSQAPEKAPRACDNCSKSKSKCLLRTGTGVCENCKFLDVACTFLRTAKKRGPPKGYISSLEQRLASLESLVADLRATAPARGGSPVYASPGDSTQTTATTTTTATSASVVPASYGNKRQAREAGLDFDQEEQQQQRQRQHQQQQQPQGQQPQQQRVRSAVIRSFQPPQGIATERSTVLGHLSVDENMTMRYHGATSGLYLITGSRVFSSPFWQFPNPGFWPRTKRTTFRTEDEILSVADSMLPSLAVQNKLIDAYWTYIHPSFPVVHRETFLFQLSKDRRRIPRAGRSALDQLERRIPQVLLLAMFALSARFVEQRQEDENSDPGDEYATRAEALIAQHKQSSINCCLALLMMAYREIGTGGSVSWMYVGNAIRMAQDLGFHRDPSVWRNTNCFKNMSSTEIQIRRLIWWGVFVLDRYISAWQGRPCGIHEDDFDTRLPDDTAQGGAKDISLACFVQVIRLSIIQGRIHRAFYSIGPNELEWERLQEFEQDLAVWEAHVPDFLSISQGNPLPVMVIMMHAQFWNCKVLLHRPFITPAISEPRTANASSLSVATTAAIAISNLVHRFTSSYSAIFAPPFFNYYVFTAAIMHLFNRSQCPLLFSQTALNHCTDCCRLMSPIWSSAARTLHIIEGVDREVSHTMPTPSMSASNLGALLVAAQGQRQGPDAVDERGYIAPGSGSPYCCTSWPSPIVDPDWLSLETWRADWSDEMAASAGSTSAQ